MNSLIQLCRRTAHKSLKTCIAGRLETLNSTCLVVSCNGDLSRVYPCDPLWPLVRKQQLDEWSTTSGPHLRHNSAQPNTNGVLMLVLQSHFHVDKSSPSSVCSVSYGGLFRIVFNTAWWWWSSYELPLTQRARPQIGFVWGFIWYQSL